MLRMRLVQVRNAIMLEVLENGNTGLPYRDKEDELGTIIQSQRAPTITLHDNERVVLAIDPTNEKTQGLAIFNSMYEAETALDKVAELVDAFNGTIIDTLPSVHVRGDSVCADISVCGEVVSMNVIHAAEGLRDLRDPDNEAEPLIFLDEDTGYYDVMLSEGSVHIGPMSVVLAVNSKRTTSSTAMQCISHEAALDVMMSIVALFEQLNAGDMSIIYV